MRATIFEEIMCCGIVVSFAALEGMQAKSHESHLSVSNTRAPDRMSTRESEGLSITWSPREVLHSEKLTWAPVKINRVLPWRWWGWRQKWGTALFLYRKCSNLKGCLVGSVPSSITVRNNQRIDVGDIKKKRRSYFISISALHTAHFSTLSQAKNILRIMVHIKSFF